MMKHKALVLFCLIFLMTGLAACKTVSNTPLPRSMKGYELYSWQDNRQWRFTLITGTNRNKTLEEIISGGQTEGADGWVNIHVNGVDALKTVLNRLPSGEFVTWNNGHVIVGQGPVNPLAFPPEGIINQIEEYANKLGLEFQVNTNY
jgi:hypothetical protein